MDILRIFTYLLGAICGYLLSAPLHECGHLLGGLLTGYRFVSLRVFRVVLSRDAGEFKLSLLKSRKGAAAGACDMSPKDDQAGVFLVNAGGLLVNMGLAIMALWLQYVYRSSPALSSFFLGFFLNNMIDFLFNLIPHTYPSANDGRNLLELRNKDARKAYITCLLLSDTFGKFKCYQDVTEAELMPAATANKNNYFVVALYIMLIEYYLAHQQIEKAQQVLDDLHPVGLPHFYQSQLEAYRLYLALIHHDLELSKQLRTKEVESAFSLDDTAMLCIKAAYEILVEGADGDELLGQLQAHVNRHPFGENRLGNEYLNQLRRLVENHQNKETV
ncbi:MAG: hypothetical protein LBR25_08875 [Erysipelotrichaceae bacterium]|jgi:hypothetical protein|nr:hypothetical protein [Erysipelotrichaceae bacterium]